MGKFGHVEKLKEVTTAPLVLEEIEGSPTLILRPATEDNAEYFNAVFKATKKRARKAKAAGLDSSSFKELRDQDRVLFSKYVVIGWKDVKDSSGKAVEFSTEDCLAFLKALPTWLFDKVRAFCNEPLNFLDDDTEVEDGDELGES